jgi:hypothetical protein
MTVIDLEGNRPGTRIVVTANRNGDTFTFSGIATALNESSIIASVPCNLTIGELVSLQYLTSSSGTIEKRARVSDFQADKYEFDLLPLNDEQQSLMAAPDSSVVGKLAGS